MCARGRSLVHPACRRCCVRDVSLRRLLPRLRSGKTVVDTKHISIITSTCELHWQIQLLMFASVASRPACRQGTCSCGAQLHVCVNRELSSLQPCGGRCFQCYVGARWCFIFMWWLVLLSPQWLTSFSEIVGVLCAVAAVFVCVLERRPLIVHICNPDAIQANGQPGKFCSRNHL